MSIDNGIVVLPDGLPVSMRFSAMKLVESQVKDRESGFMSTVKRLICQVIELNGKPVLERYDTLAEKLWQQLLPYANDSALSKKQFTITKSGKGYGTEYSVAVQ